MTRVYHVRPTSSDLNSMRNSGRVKIRVFCVGNPQRGDDGVGHIVADLLTGEENIVLDKVRTPAEILDKLTGEEECVIVVDAMEKATTPGKVHRLTSIENLSTKTPWRSTHSLTLPEVLKIAESLSLIPKNLLVYGVEGASFEYMAPVSEDVMRACYVVAEEIRRLARQIL